MSEEKIAVHVINEKEYHAVTIKRGKGNCGGWLNKGEDKEDEGGVCLNANDGTWCSKDYYEEQGYTIIPAPEYLKEKGEEFKVGDRVEILQGADIDFPRKCRWNPAMNRYVGVESTIGVVSVAEGRYYLGVDGGNHYWHKSWLKKASPNQSKTTKKEERKMSSVNVNNSIKKVFNKDSFELVEKMQEHFGDEIAQTFTGALLLENNKQAYVDEIARIDKEKAEAEKAAKKK